jgi:hypothetical protein
MILFESHIIRKFNLDLLTKLPCARRMVALVGKTGEIGVTRARFCCVYQLLNISVARLNQTVKSSIACSAYHN